MDRGRTKITRHAVATAILAFAVTAMAPTLAGAQAPASASHVPQGHAPADAALNQAIAAALPANAAQVLPPVPVQLGSLGKVEVVLYRRSTNDGLFRGVVLIPTSTSAWRAQLLPDEQELAGNYEEITTAVLAADIGLPDPGRAVEGGANQGIPQTLPAVPGTPAPLTPPAEAAPPTRGARPEGIERALVILFYSHQFGHTDSDAFGRVFLYEGGTFRIDGIRSHLLDGVRTAAVARLRLAPTP